MNFLLFWCSFMHINFISPIRLWASQVKNPPANAGDAEMQVQFLS